MAVAERISLEMTDPKVEEFHNLWQMTFSQLELFDPMSPGPRNIDADADPDEELSCACRMSVSAIFSRQCRVGRHVGDMSPGRHHVSAILGPDNVVSFLSAPDMSASRT